MYFPQLALETLWKNITFAFFANSILQQAKNIILLVQQNLQTATHAAFCSSSMKP